MKIWACLYNLKVKTGCLYSIVMNPYTFPNVLKYFLFQNKVFLLFMFSCFIILLMSLYFLLFHLFYGKMVYQPLIMRQNCSEKMSLTVKVLQAHSCMAAAKGKWTLSSLDWLALLLTAVSLFPIVFCPVCYLSAHGIVTYMDSVLGLSDFCGQSHLVKSNPVNIVISSACFYFLLNIKNLKE